MSSVVLMIVVVIVVVVAVVFTVAFEVGVVTVGVVVLCGSSNKAVEIILIH